MDFWTWLLPAALIAFLAVVYILYVRASWSLERKSFSFAGRRFALTKADIIPLAAIMLLYAVVAFWALGDTKSVKSNYEAASGRECVIDLEGEREVGSFLLWSGHKTGVWQIETSLDGENWTFYSELGQNYAAVLKWNKVSVDEPVKAAYVRILCISGEPDLGEIGVFTPQGEMIILSPESALTDEQELVPYGQSYLNGTYFDEIYHVRTAIEHLRGENAYETSHPPLGKLIISIGIRLFGQTPFGWRFMGTLFGVIMLAGLYVLIKVMFGKTAVAAAATVMFAFDFMHFVQTRIATIDTYAVFFIIFSYLFFYLWLTRQSIHPKSKDLLWLGLSGLSFGLGAASKWTVFYAGAGLALLYVIDLVLRLKERSEGAARGITETVLWSILFFVIVPAIIYLLSYIPYARGEGLSGGLSLLCKGEFYKEVLENQRFMFSYHSKLVATHPYSSPWYSWIIDSRPILYWLDYYADGTKSAFGAWGSPVLYWGGIGALAASVFSLIKRRDGRNIFILVGYLAQLLPWVPITRPTFAYHYFPATVFLAIAFAGVFDAFLEAKPKKGLIPVCALPAVSIALFVLFYPMLTGAVVERSFCLNVLKWFESWPVG